jgi:type II secretory pathway component PulJ
MSWRSGSRDKGVTLVEVLIAMSILIVVSMVLVTFSIQGSEMWHLITSQSDLRSSARNAMHFMTQELQGATRKSGEIPPADLSIPPRPNNTTMSFYLPRDIDGNGLIIDAFGKTEWDKNNRIQYQYFPDVRRLCRLEQGNQYIIAQDVASIAFEDQSIDPSLYDNEVRIIMRLERTTQRARIIRVDLTSLVRMRNQ